jgi:hypothetical protein
VWHQLTFVVCCRKAEQARVLQGEVVQLYTLWDNAHHQMAGGLSHTQVKEKALQRLNTQRHLSSNYRN